MVQKKVIIVGAGPGGLTSGMILAHRGFDVHIFEKNSKVGGRNSNIEAKGFTFDIGPTFLMMKFILDQVFEEAGANSSDYLKFTKIDPMYRLMYRNNEVMMSSDHAKMRATIAKQFPGNEKGYDRFLAVEKKRFELMLPCLQKEYGNILTMMHPDLLKAMPYLSLGKSMWQELDKYFDDPDLKMCFTFQSKYLGMSPWECPAAFMIMTYMEHGFGIHHVEGGLSQISFAMEKVAKKNGATMHKNAEVKQLIIEKNTVKGIELTNGKKIFGDEVIVNADFAYSMSHLIPDKNRHKYTDAKLEKKKYSCSTFMIYLGLDKVYDIPHHNIVFSEDYEQYVNDIAAGKKLSNDLSVYIRNASISDSTDAPKGKSAIYILVPAPNNFSGIDWNKETKRYRKRVLEVIKNRTELKDIEKHIVYEKIITPFDWENDFNVYKGATFSLAHNLMQMLILRPHNRFEELNNCFLAGGGTHPGSGLPTIYESARITANLISKDAGIAFKSKNLHVQ